MVFKRKIYKDLLRWKAEANGEKALLIEGARRVGKSTIVEEFAKNEYQSYLLIDFTIASNFVKEAFYNHLNDLDTFYMMLNAEYHTELFPRKSLIIFDEIQRFPKAREAIKYLVKDGRYDFIETGSLISIKENVKDINIPSEERKIKMFPMDFEEFCEALNEKLLFTYIKNCFDKLIPIEETLSFSTYFSTAFTIESNVSLYVVVGKRVLSKKVSSLLFKHAKVTAHLVPPISTPI